MSTLRSAQIRTLLEPFLRHSGEPPFQTIGSGGDPRQIVPHLFTEVPETLFEQLAVYLDLLLKWNARTNLTSIREPEQIVVRHFGESLFAGLHLTARLPPDATLLDLGSGAGFPGLPIHLLAPDLHVLLAESQNKKSTFLREVVRTLGLRTEIFAGRIETLAAERRFDAVTLRAVDHMPLAIQLARARLAPQGCLSVLAGDAEMLPGAECIPVPGSGHSYLLLQSA